MIDHKAELALNAYIQTFVQAGEPLFGTTLYEGHRFGEIKELPRITLTALNKGGDLANSGVYTLKIQVLIVSAGADLVAHYDRVKAILGIFGPDNIDALLAAVNSPASPVPGICISCLGLDPETDLSEARDAEKGQMGTALPFKATASLK